MSDAILTLTVIVAAFFGVIAFTGLAYVTACEYQTARTKTQRARVVKQSMAYACAILAFCIVGLPLASMLGAILSR